MPDMNEIRDMIEVIAAVERSVVEKSPLLLEGPPGIGCTMVARRITTIMPEMTLLELEEVATIYARVHTDTDWTPTVRPFRCPHHTVSTGGLIGSGERFGEVHLATYGVLFLDGLPEFPMATIECLGDWMRTCGEGPRPLLIASAHPCPCGWNGYGKVRKCLCSDDAIFRFRSRTAAMCDQLGITRSIGIPSIALADLKDGEPGESSETIRARVAEARS